MTYRFAHINDVDHRFKSEKLRNCYCVVILFKRDLAQVTYGAIKFKRTSVKREKMQKEVAATETVEL